MREYCRGYEGDARSLDYGWLGAWWIAWRVVGKYIENADDWNYCYPRLPKP